MCTVPYTSYEPRRLDRSRWLERAPLWLQPASPEPDWPLREPRLAGSPTGSDEDLIRPVHDSEDGADVNGCDHPLPQFRMGTEDAQAVVAYLRSLSPSKEREPQKP